MKSHERFWLSIAITSMLYGLYLFHEGWGTHPPHVKAATIGLDIIVLFASYLVLILIVDDIDKSDKYHPIGWFILGIKRFNRLIERLKMF